MKENKLPFIKGFGSLIDIAPNPSYTQKTRSQSVEKRIEHAWIRVKFAFEKTLKEFPNQNPNERR